MLTRCLLAILALAPSYLAVVSVLPWLTSFLSERATSVPHNQFHDGGSQTPTRPETFSPPDLDDRSFDRDKIHVTGMPVSGCQAT
jgi:hypothetical protein